MRKKVSEHPSLRTTKFCIWTILYQDLIVAYFRVYIVLATLFVLFLNLAGKIGTTVAFGGLMIGGTALATLTVCLIVARKRSLLAISDPDLREVAHEAMIVYLSRKRLSEREKRFIMKRLRTSACVFKRC
ncbi:hypothetical protein DENIS_1428 [Desulfonema ishimotonii]|uniref:Uncharacterized protein n=1 Tax=Desulfonema ishimotonii TaxID=45657 RepID=A0A401FU45_9BACT|nr:hypothetical protein [Desulfonema ishimotonii]GBC60475.1 hypothetical protein DENIS_1428 [Desulfonema ishimotonii]